jgi:predicted acetyltransferase
MLELRLPKAADEAVLRSAYAELAGEGHDGFLLDGFDDNPQDFSGWLSRVYDHSEGLNIPEGKVPATFLLAVVSGEVVGRISIRHQLNDFLMNFGGHIGYMVRPSHRRKGYATEMLRQAKAIAKSLGINIALVTCNDDNLGSITVIESQGGVLENIVDENGRALRRYWITL